MAMTRDQLLYNKLAEEAVEVAHVALKIAQLGGDSIHPDSGVKYSNTEKLKNELADLAATVELMEVKELLPVWSIEQRYAYTIERWAKMEKWAKVSEDRGFVDKEA